MRKINWSVKFLVFLFFVFSVAFPLVVSAAPLNASDLGIQYASATGLGTTDVRTVIARIIRVALGLIGIIAVAGIVVGGFMYMTAGGNEEKTSNGTKAVAAGVIGLAIVLSAYAIANFVISKLMEATA